MTFTAQHGFDGRNLTIFVPKESVDGCYALQARSVAKHNGHLTLTIDTPHRPLTRGPKKRNKDDKGFQMNHAWGHATQIANEIGEDGRDVLYEACIASTPRYPTRMDAFGKIKAKRWSLASIEEAAVVIEKLHEIAAKWTPPIRLRESTEAVYEAGGELPARGGENV